MKKCITSWDDGHPLDIKIAELLLKYCIGGIFYLPIVNKEGLPTLKPKQIRWLAEHFVIGGHTYNHVDLTTVTDREAYQEISVGKEALEHIIGKPITTFCYPRGHFTSVHQQLVKKAGFTSARSARLLATNHGTNRWATDPHFHCYPHSPLITAAHSIKHHDLPTLRASKSLWPNPTPNRIVNFSQSVKENYFHLWGHSWEIDTYNYWEVLESTLALFSNYES